MDWARKSAGEATKAMNSHSDMQYGKEDFNGLK